jgi:hypothetical protein
LELEAEEELADSELDSIDPDMDTEESENEHPEKSTVATK